MSRFIVTPAARVVEGAAPEFGHRLGGRSSHNGTTPKGCRSPLHFIYEFDTADPAFPLKIPGIRRLPLFFSFRFNGGACGYRVKSESEIEVLYMEIKKVASDFPYPEYPSEFPERQVRLESISYEQHKAIAFYIAAGEEALEERDRKLVLDDLGYPFTQLGGIHRMWQGIPIVSCPNPACENSKYTCFMDVFAVIWNQPHKGVFLWDPDDTGCCDVQVIFQICPKCFSIHACNRCT